MLRISYHGHLVVHKKLLKNLELMLRVHYYADFHIAAVMMRKGTYYLLAKIPSCTTHIIYQVKAKALEVRIKYTSLPKKQTKDVNNHLT